MESKLLQYTKFYKGEGKNPFINDETKYLFWNLERRYVSDHVWRDMFIPNAKRLLGNSVPVDDIERKAIYLFIVAMLMKWQGDVSEISKY